MHPTLNLFEAPWRRLSAAVLALALAGCATPTALDTAPVARQLRPSPLPLHWDRGVFMEIFVRGYQDSDGDGIGDLRGLISRLDYLKDLGIRGLWLMPVTPSADGDHGYATTDFRNIDPAYGTLADFDELLKQAHARGIGIIIDYVINHAAAQHPMFVQSRQGPNAPFRDWFVWADEQPKGWSIWDANPWYHTASQPWTFPGPAKAVPQPPAGSRGFYFGTFGPHMPDFNFRNPAVKAYHFDSLRFWLNRGLDGFRLDATPHLIETSAKDWNDQPESRRITREMADLIRSYPNRTVVCEATAKPAEWGDLTLCGGAFAFGYVHHFSRAALGDAESVQALARYYRSQAATMASFVSNHDIFAGRRLWDQVGGDPIAYRLAAAAYLLQPGTPFVYYGEEVGQAGVHTLSGDLPLRTPMSWTGDPRTGGFTRGTPFRPVAPNVTTHNVAAQQADPESLLNFYKAMIALRNTRASIARGSFEQSFAQGKVLGFQRALGAERTQVLINYDTQPHDVALPGVSAQARMRSLFPANTAAASVGADGQRRMALPARSVTVLALD